MQVCRRESSLGAGDSMSFAIPLKVVEDASKSVFHLDAATMGVMLHQPYDSFTAYILHHPKVHNMHSASSPSLRRLKAIISTSY